MKAKTKMMWTALLLVGVLLAAAFFYQKVSPSQQDVDQPVQEAIKAENFEVQDRSGHIVYLTDFYDGKPILINFWASGCSPCRQEMPDFEALYQQYGDQVHFLMIDCIGALGETQAEGMAFIDQESYTFPVYCDVDQYARKVYGVTSLPTTCIINGQQEIVAGGTGMIDPAKVTTILDQLLKGDVSHD